MGNIIAIAISGVFLFFVLLGFIVGLIRGFKKTVIRTIFIIVIGVLLMFITTKIPSFLVKADITWIPGIENALKGATTIEEFLSIMITSSAEGVEPGTVQSLISLATAIISMLISGVLFLVLFLLLKYLTLPIYWILNIFIGRSKNKHRLLGGLTGAVLGVVIFTFISTPIVGYANLVNKVNEIPISGLTPTPYVASAEEENEGGILKEGPLGEIIDAFDNSIVMKVYDTVGIKKLQLVIFNQTSAVKFNKETIKVNDEIDSVGNVVVKVISFVNGPVDFSDFESILNDPEKIEYLSTNVPDILDSLYQSKIFTVTLDTAMPIVSGIMEKAITDSLLEESSIDPALQEPLTHLFTDLFSGLANSEAEDISNVFNAVIEIATIYPKISSEEGITSLTAEEYGKIGSVLDSLISSEFVKQQTISEFVPAVLDLAIKNAASEGGELPEAVTTLIEDVKQAFNSEGIVYANELKAISEFVSSLTSLEIGEGTSINGELLKTFGASLDKAFTYDSKILTRNLVDNLVVNILDMAMEGENSELEKYGEIFEQVKKPFINHEISCYEKEFEAFGEIYDYVNSLGSVEELEFSEVGKKLDSVLEKDSKIINRELVNSIISVLVDEIATNIDEDLKPTIDKIKEKIGENEISYEKEFGVIEKLLNTFENIDGEELNLAEIGKTLDEITLESSIIDNEVIGTAVSVFIDNFTGDLDEDFKPTIDKIEDKIASSDISFEKEFGVIEKLINTIDSINSEDLDLAKIGKTLDEIMVESEILDHDVISSTISIFMDKFTGDISEDFKPTIDKIEDKIASSDISFEKEFGVIQKLINTIDSINGEDFDLAKVGKTLDEITVESEILDHDVISSTVSIFIDKFTGELDEDLKPTVSKIEEKLGNSNVSFEKEFGAIQELLDTFENANGEGFNLPEVGKTLDEIIAKSDIIDHEIVNSAIQGLIDEISGDIQGSFVEIINDVKLNFNRNDFVYEKEFIALDKLLVALNSADGIHTDLVKFGKDIDYILTNLQSKVITRGLINSSVQILIDEAIEVKEEYQNTIAEIKNGFNRNDLVYEEEFTAIDNLLDAFDKATENSVSLSVFGKQLDDTLALNSKVITKKLINEFIASSFDTFVTDGDVNSAGSLADSILNIKVRILDDNYQVESYETEFIAIDKIIEIASVAGNLSMQDMDKKLFDGNTKTIGEVFDDKIKDSVLLGDCGIYVIDSLIDNLNSNNHGDENFIEITNTISKNFEDIKPNVKCASNKNLTNSGTISYSQLANAFVEIEHYLDDSTHKVTGQTEFTLDIAEYYEEALEDMQNNILLDKNGTRAVASYICDEIAIILEDKAQSISNPIVANVIRSYKDIILNYKAYLKRPETLDNNKLNEKEHYNTSGTLYAVSTDGYLTNITFTDTKPSTSYACISKPFTSIASEIGEYL